MMSRIAIKQCLIASKPFPIWTHYHFLPTTIVKIKWRLKKDFMAFLDLAFDPSSSHVYIWFKISFIPHKAPFKPQSLSGL